MHTLPGLRLRLTSNEQFDATRLGDLPLVIVALLHEIRGISIEDMHVFRIDIDVLEEVIVHVVVITLRVISGQIYLKYVKY